MPTMVASTRGSIVTLYRPHYAADDATRNDVPFARKPQCRHDSYQCRDAPGQQVTTSFPETHQKPYEHRREGKVKAQRTRVLQSATERLTDNRGPGPRHERDKPTPQQEPT